MTYPLSISYQNKFSFTCPIFAASTKLAACVMLRDKIWRGENVPVRKGCQACMHASKCPATAIVNQILRNWKEPPDAYGSLEPVEGKLRADILEQILPVVVPDRELVDVPPGERALILSANDRIAKQLGVAPSAKASSRPAQRMKPPAPLKPAKTNDTILNAAATGDMAAAINGAS